MKEVPMDWKFVLREKGISPTFQRLQIIAYLEENRVHPSVEMIFNSLKNLIPTLSRTTVYNTMKLFQSVSLVKPILSENNEIHYEFNMEPHAHFECTECGKIYDVFEEFEFIKDRIVDGHKVTEHQISLKGICSKCLEENNA